MYDIMYRPRTLSECVGSEKIKQLLKKRIQTGHICDRSLLFSGPKGSGKTTMARIVAASIVCDNVVDGEPCTVCDSCMSMNYDDSTSVYEMDAAAHGSVDTIRSIVDGSSSLSIDGKRVVLILDEAHRLSKSAQDCLLKPMEDRRLMVIMCTTEPHAIREALRSRMDEYQLSYPSRTEVCDYVCSVCDKESIQYKKEDIKSIVDNDQCLRTVLSGIHAAVVTGTDISSYVNAMLNVAEYETIANAMSIYESDNASCISMIDCVVTSHGPAWVSDAIRHLAISVYKNNRGIRHSYKSRIPGGIDETSILSISKAISSIQNPSAIDIMVCLMKTTPQQDVKSSLKLSKTPVSDIKEIKESAKKTFEVDGIKFTSDETLTSIDHKIEKGNKMKDEKQENKYVTIKKDTNNARQLNEQQFRDSLLKRIRGQPWSGS